MTTAEMRTEQYNDLKTKIEAIYQVKETGQMNDIVSGLLEPMLDKFEWEASVIKKELEDYGFSVEKKV
jgi:hypothetical protein